MWIMEWLENDTIGKLKSENAPLLWIIRKYKFVLFISNFMNFKSRLYHTYRHTFMLNYVHTKGMNLNIQYWKYYIIWICTFGKIYHWLNYSKLHKNHTYLKVIKYGTNEQCQTPTSSKFEHYHKRYNKQWYSVYKQ